MTDLVVRYISSHLVGCCVAPDICATVVFRYRILVTHDMPDECLCSLDICKLIALGT